MVSPGRGGITEKSVKHFTRLFALVTLVAVGCSSSQVLAGETMLKLLKVLKDRGSISEAEYQMLIEAAQEEAVAAPPPQATIPPASPEPPTALPAAVSTPATATAAAPDAATPASRAETMREKTDMTSPSVEAINQALKGKWYERVSFRGYAQLRYSYVTEEDGAALNVPNDASASETSSFLLRRGRVILSGDVTDHLFLYAQMDYNASLSSGEFTLAMRDYYGDIALDEAKEFRFRVGQSKVPFGWVNLQSSQNRAPVERPDALNSAVEGERDIGAYFYWAPQEARKRYRDLVRLGLKGSGDYGVLGIGAYSGQGLNRLDLNGEPHVIARLNYPWKLASGQFIETGIQAYHGRFVSPVSTINLGAGNFTPTRSPDGVDDQRVAATFVWYPQPFGVEAEWNFGRGPELNPASGAIEEEFLHGGYVQLAYRIPQWHGDWYPFTRWQYYDGGRKFAANAPHARVNELDFGLEWQPWPELELVVSYTHTFERTNTRVSPYADTDSAGRVAFQLQFNF